MMPKKYELDAYSAAFTAAVALLLRTTSVGAARLPPLSQQNCAAAWKFASGPGEVKKRRFV